MDEAVAALQQVLDAMEALSAELDTLLGASTQQEPSTPGFAWQKKPFVNRNHPFLGTFGLILNTQYDDKADLDELSGGAAALRSILNEAKTFSVDHTNDAQAADMVPDGEPSPIESVRCVYFMGHGDNANLILAPSGTRVALRALGFSAHLRWLVADACETLSCDPAHPFDVFDRWSSAIATLDGVLGFSSVGTPTPLRAEYFALYISEGASLSEAWRRACEETQLESNQRWATLLVEREHSLPDEVGLQSLEGAEVEPGAPTAVYLRQGAS